MSFAFESGKAKTQAPSLDPTPTTSHGDGLRRSLSGLGYEEAMRRLSPGRDVPVASTDLGEDDEVLPATELPVAVQIVVEDFKVRDVLVAGRPPDAMVGGMGDHVAPWSLIVESVRTRLVGQNVTYASSEVEDLITYAASLPGMKRLEATEPFQREMVENAHREALRAAEKARHQREGGVLPALQEAVSWYLAFRNAIPLTAVNQGVANGKGEAKRIRALRKGEEVGDNVFGLLDHGAVAETVGTPGLDQVDRPGDDSSLSDEERCGAYLAQHWAEAQVAAGHHRGLDLAAFVRQFVKKTALLVDERALIAEVEEQLREVELPLKRQAKQVRAGGSVAGKVGVVVGLSFDDEGRITAVRTAGRPASPFGKSMGDHSSAWGLLVESAAVKLEGCDIDEAQVALAELLAHADGLPGMATAGELAPAQAQQLTKAREAAGLALRLVASEGIDIHDRISRLQDAIVCYLAYRNLVPLSAVQRGRATGHGESAYLGVLQAHSYTEDFEGSVDDVREAIIKLLDVRAILDGAGELAGTVDAPGTRKNEPLLNAARYVAQHLKETAVAYRYSVEQSGFLGDAGVLGGALVTWGGLEGETALAIAAKALELLG